MMRARLTLLGSLPLAVCLLVGCNEKAEEPLLCQDPQPPAEPAALVAGMSSFGFDLFARTTEPDASVILSPLSVSTALAMLYVGAGGDTAEQMRQVMHFPYASDALSEPFGELLDTLDSRNLADPEHEVALRVADSIWVAPDAPLSPAYAETLGTDFHAPPTTAPFPSDPDGARRDINSWVEERTENRITELLPAGSIDVGTEFVFVNALYLKAQWFTPFSEDATTAAVFHAIDGSETQARMMRRDGFASYSEDTGVQAVELSYDSAGLVMDVILPAAGTFESYRSGFSADAFNRVLSCMMDAEGTLEMPRFVLRPERVELGSALYDMGMRAPFESAEFPGIGLANLALGEVYHKAFVAVDEKGTEAAAATGGMAHVSAAVSADIPHFQFRADRPFLFVIRDWPTGAVLFIGQVTDV